MANELRWGIIGTGRIAHAFAAGLRDSRTGSLHGVGSRCQSSAEGFGREFDVSRCYASYQALLDDPEIDVVYVATPNSLHLEHALLALNAGKPVLCEKPFTVNVQESNQLVSEARKQGLFLMEAMWNRFFPITVRLRQMIEAGELGELCMIEADFGFRSTSKEEPLLYDTRFGGGSLLDVGVYGVSLVSMVWGKPTKIVSSANIGDTGVDEQCAAVLSYDQGRMGVVRSSILADTPQEATFIGDQGRIRIESPFWCPSAMVHSKGDETGQRIELPHTGNGYQYEADEVGQCLLEGRLESRQMPLDESLQIMATMDQIRSCWSR